MSVAWSTTPHLGQIGPSGQIRASSHSRALASLWKIGLEKSDMANLLLRVLARWVPSQKIPLVAHMYRWSEGDVIQLRPVTKGATELALLLDRLPSLETIQRLARHADPVGLIEKALLLEGSALVALSADLDYQHKAPTMSR